MASRTIQPEMRGVIVACCTPFDETGNVTLEPLGRHIDACLDEGVHGFWINGCSGLAPLLDTDERKRIAEYASEKINRRAPMWVHVGAWNTAESCALAEHARRHGAIGVSTLPPLFYNTSLPRIVAHMTAIQNAAGVPITYYHVPGVTKVTLDAEQLVALCEQVPNVAAIKFSDIDIFKACVIREHAPHVRLMTGFEEILLAGLAMGCFDGTVGAGQNFLPGPLVDVYHAFGDHDLDRARHIHRGITRLLDIQGRFDFTSATYAFLNLLGFHAGRPRPPMTCLCDEEHALVRGLSLKVVRSDPFDEQRLIRSSDFLETSLTAQPKAPAELGKPEL